VPLEKFIETAIAEKADAIGMSALLVQTSNHMITVQKMLKERGLDLPLLIGGAPVSTRHAASVAMWGQDDFEQMNSRVFYCQSGMDGVNIMNILVDTEKRDALIRDNAAKLKKFYRLAKEQAERAARENATLPLRQVDPNWDKPRFVLDPKGVAESSPGLSRIGDTLGQTTKLVTDPKGVAEPLAVFPPRHLRDDSDRTEKPLRSPHPLRSQLGLRRRQAMGAKGHGQSQARRPARRMGDPFRKRRLDQT
jgi:hypothetical protein